MNRREALRKTAWLGGTAIATPTLLTLLQSCQTVERAGWQPVILNDAQAQTVSALADTILPRTDTPSATELNVDVFIDRAIHDMLPEDAQQEMLAGLDAFEERCQRDYGKSFADMSTDERHAMLRQEEAEAGTYNPSVWGGTLGEQKPVGFYRQFKSMALWGYFTSEHIGENVLSYDPVPGTYQGCIPASDVGNSWSL